MKKLACPSCGAAPTCLTSLWACLLPHVPPHPLLSPVSPAPVSRPRLNLSANFQRTFSGSLSASVYVLVTWSFSALSANFQRQLSAYFPGACPCCFFKHSNGFCTFCEFFSRIPMNSATSTGILSKIDTPQGICNICSQKLDTSLCFQTNETHSNVLNVSQTLVNM